MDLTKDYSSETLGLKNDYEGKVTAVLTSANSNIGKRKSVLYLHGFVDYFFHPHLGEQFNQHNFDFFALDMRKHGRSLLPHQHPNYCKSITEYFEEISLAIRKIKNDSTSIFLLAHSTGGLTASNYMNFGQEKDAIAGLILNSPFLDFNQSRIEKALSLFVSKIIAKVSDYSKIEGALAPAYAQSVHKSYFGEWDFNLDWKPIRGFPTYFKWILAIAQAQKKLETSDIKIPILILHSSGSLKMSKFSEAAMTHDIVLNVEDIKRVGAKLGEQVTIVKVENAQHDIFLSRENVRAAGFKKMFAWLLETEFNQ